MGDRTAIAWTEKTWNPWQGCTKVSPGCAHCYMFRDKRKYGQDPEIVVRSKPPTFNAPLKWKEPARVFTCSWSDFFHADADEWRDDAWDVIRRTPHLTYQILTKRPERILSHLPADWGKQGWPNVWLGTSVENQHFADIRIPLLLKVPAVVRFLSCEPLLGPLDLMNSHAFSVQDSWGEWSEPRTDADGSPAIKWVIVGGESGPGFRVMDLQWARDIREQCDEAGVPYFFKQSSGLRPGQGEELDGRLWQEFPMAGAHRGGNHGYEGHRL